MSLSARGQQIALEWTTYCKRKRSMAFAESSGSLILLRYQDLYKAGVYYDLRNVSVLDEGLEIEGIYFPGFEMPQPIKDDIDAHLRDWADLQDAKERRRQRDGEA